MANKRRLRKQKRKVMSDLKHFRKMWACMWDGEKGEREFWDYLSAFADLELKDL